MICSLVGSQRTSGHSRVSRAIKRSVQCTAAQRQRFIQLIQGFWFFHVVGLNKETSSPDQRPQTCVFGWTEANPAQALDTYGGIIGGIRLTVPLLGGLGWDLLHTVGWKPAHLASGAALPEAPLSDAQN